MTVTNTELPSEAVQLARTDTMTRALHLVECPHLVGKLWHDASHTELLNLSLCRWSQDQLDGHGRIHPATLDDAMREHGTPTAAVSQVRAGLGDVEYDEIWLPYSRSYVALGRYGRAVASFGKTWIWVQGRGRRELAGYTSVCRAGHSKAPSYGAVCPSCHLSLPLAGGCPTCH